MVVDASVWMAAAVPADTHHRPSRVWLQRYSQTGGPLYVPNLVLAEVGGAVSRRTNDITLGRRAVRHVAAVPGLSLIALDQGLALQAAALATSLHITGADAVYVAVAVRYGVPLVTWDEQLYQRAGAVISVIRP